MATDMVSREEPPAKRSRAGSIEEAPEISRSSSLKSPIMLLTGHDAPISTIKFDPSGRYVASAGHDRRIFLWNVQGDCENFNVLDGHKNAVLDLQWNSSGSKIITASADKTVGLFDIVQGKRQKKYTGHTAVVNSISMSRGQPQQAMSGGDDGLALVWDFRSRTYAQRFESKYSITACSFAADDTYMFTAGIDNVVKAWDTRKEEVVFTMEGHTDTVTGMSLSPDGASLLTNSMDRTMIAWDARPHNTEGRLSKVFEGAQHNLEKTLLKCSWSPDGDMVSCGSSDHVVHIWDVPTTEELYNLPGHAGSVNEVAFHPTEPIIGSCGSDKQIYLGEL